METRAPYIGQNSVAVDALDRVSFYEQNNAALAAAVEAVNSGDVQVVADCVSRLAFIRTTNPNLSGELQARWQDIDSDQ